MSQSLQIKYFQSQTANWKTYKATKLPNIQLKLYASPSNLAQWTKQPSLVCKTHADQTEAPTKPFWDIAMSNKYQLLHSQELVGKTQNPKRNVNQLNY